MAITAADIQALAATLATARETERDATAAEEVSRQALADAQAATLAANNALQAQVEAWVAELDAAD